MFCLWDGFQRQETLESVKKCKNFLVTLIKLASSDSRTPSMANNVRGLVKSLLVRHPDSEESRSRVFLTDVMFTQISTEI